MKLLDVNLLLYAKNPDFPEHARVRRWLEELLESGEPVGLAWITIVAFLRLATNPRLFPRPLSVSEALETTDSWLRRPTVSLLRESEDHWEVFEPIIRAADARADLITDAHLAAIAVEHAATLCTNDRDFGLFPGLKLLDPLAAT